MLTTAVCQMLLFAHTLAFAFAIVAVLREDLALWGARRVDAVRLAAVSRNITQLLVLLWITGLGLIALQSGFAMSVLLKPKLAAKLTVVCILTLNGVLLHWVAFPLMTQPQRSPRQAANICTALGSISSVTWIYAAFVGGARLIAPAMSYCGFLALYLVSLMGGLGVGLWAVRPRLLKILKRCAAPERQIELALRSTLGRAARLMLDETTRQAFKGQPAAYVEALTERIPATMLDARAEFLLRVQPVLEAAASQ